jgi:hypothetical protein
MGTSGENWYRIGRLVALLRFIGLRLSAQGASTQGRKNEIG